MKKLLSLLLIFIFQHVHAQQLWDIERCIRHALDNNIQIKQLVTDIEVARLGVDQAKMAYVPSMNASMNYSTNWGRSLDPTTYSFTDQTANNFSTGVSVGTTVFSGMQKLHALRKADIGWQRAIQNNEQLKNEITIAVTGAYLDVLYAKEQIANSLTQINAIQEQTNRTKKLVDAGSQPLGTLLELQSQMASEQFTLVTAQNNQANSLLTLKQLLEIKEDNSFDVDIPTIDTLPESMIADLHKTYRQALNLPQIKVAELQQNIADQDLSLAKSRMYPTLNFGVNYGSSWSDARQKPTVSEGGAVYFGKYPFFEQLADNAATSMQLSLSIPIFNSLNASRNIRVAKWNKKRAELGVTLAQDRLYKEIQKAYTDAKGALEKFRAATSSLKNSSEAFNYAAQKFSAGATTVADYEIARSNLVVAQSVLSQAKYEYLFRVKILDFYGGIPITL